MKIIKNLKINVQNLFKKELQQKKKLKESLEKADFYLQLGNMLGAGLNLVQALEIQKDTGYIRQELKNGKRLYQIFSSLNVRQEYISFIKIGEMTGQLNRVCINLSKNIKDKSDLKSKIIFACMYPALIGLMSLSMCIFLVSYIFPKVMPVFQSMKVDLPMSTKILIFTSNFFKDYWFYIFIFILFLFGILFFLYKKSIRFQRIILVAPIKYIKGSLQMKTLAMFNEAGISLEKALQESLEIESNNIYREVLKSFHKKIIQGESFSLCLENRIDLYPLNIHHLIKAGEASGKLKEMCEVVGSLYEEKLNSIIKIITSFMEPIIMIVMGGIIGFIALSIISPLYSFTNNV